MMNNPRIIAIDGPAASGKGTLARRIARHYQMVHLDTGKLYRAVGYQLIHSSYNVEQASVPGSDAARHAVKLAENLDISCLDDLNLADEGVGEAASIVSALPDVRAALLDFQRKVANAPEGAVLDGRDIGSVVCPDADIKLYITGDIEIRAKRRFKQLQSTDNSVIYADVLENLRARDERDSNRKTAPLGVADGAISIDTSHMDMDEVFEKVTAIIENATS